MPDTFRHAFGQFDEAPAVRWQNFDHSPGGVVAVSAEVDPTAVIADKAVVWPHARIGASRLATGVVVGRRAEIGSRATLETGVSIGAHTKVQEGVPIGKRATLGDRVSVLEGSSIGEHAWIGAGVEIVAASIGEGCHIHGGVTIGQGSTIGDGAAIGALCRIGSFTMVGVRAAVGEQTSIGDDAWIGDRAVLGARAVIDNGVIFEKDDWIFVAGPMGEPPSWLTAVWSPVHGLRWWPGWNVYFEASIAEVLGHQPPMSTEALLSRLRNEPRAAPAEDYMHLIKLVSDHPGLVRAKAKAGAADRTP